jgi:hypothetical protein
MIGDIGDLLDRLTHIETLGEQYQPFVAEVRRLAQKFDIGAIQIVLGCHEEAQ